MYTWYYYGGIGAYFTSMILQYLSERADGIFYCWQSRRSASGESSPLWPHNSDAVCSARTMWELIKRDAGERGLIIAALVAKKPEMQNKLWTFSNTTIKKKDRKEKEKARRIVRWLESYFWWKHEVLLISCWSSSAAPTDSRVRRGKQIKSLTRSDGAFRKQTIIIKKNHFTTWRLYGSVLQFSLCFLPR